MGTPMFQTHSNMAHQLALIDKRIDPSIPVLDLTKPFTSDTVIPEPSFRSPG